MLKITFLFLLAMSIAIINIGCEEDATGTGEGGGQAKKEEPQKLTDDQTNELKTTVDSATALTDEEKTNLKGHIDAVKELKVLTQSQITTLTEAFAKGTKDDIEGTVSVIESIDISSLTNADKEKIQALVKNALKIAKIGEVPEFKEALVKLERELSAYFERIKKITDELTKLASFTENMPTAEITAISTALEGVTETDVNALPENQKTLLRNVLVPLADGGDKAISELITALQTQIDATPAPTNKDELEAKKAALTTLKGHVDKIIGWLPEPSSS